MVSRRASAAIATLGLLAATACTFPEVPIDPGEAKLVVHVVLDAGRDDQAVRVGLTDGAAQPGPQPAFTATVTITTPDGIVMTSVNGADIVLSKYNHRLVPGGIYSLRATSSLGHIVTGTTTIPGVTTGTLTPAAESFDRLRDTLRIPIPAAGGAAAAYELTIGQVYHDAYSRTAYRFFASDDLSLAGTARIPFDDSQMFPAGVRTHVVLAAVDANYYEYYRVLSDPFTGAAPSRLSGGLGVFGAMVPVTTWRLDVR